jgi:hypothetical protein
MVVAADVFADLLERARRGLGRHALEVLANQAQRVDRQAARLGRALVLVADLDLQLLHNGGGLGALRVLDRDHAAVRKPSFRAADRQLLVGAAADNIDHLARRRAGLAFERRVHAAEALAFERAIAARLALAGDRFAMQGGQRRVCVPGRGGRACNQTILLGHGEPHSSGPARFSLSHCSNPSRSRSERLTD